MPESRSLIAQPPGCDADKIGEERWHYTIIAFEPLITDRIEIDLSFDRNNPIGLIMPFDLEIEFIHLPFKKKY
jgi:hypothetical protein